MPLMKYLIFNSKINNRIRIIVRVRIRKMSHHEQDKDKFGTYLF